MKRNEDAAFLSKDELYSQLSETKLRIALLAQQESETEAMPGEGEEEKRFFEATEAGALKAIHRQLHKQSVQHFLQRDLPKVGRIAAAVLLIFYLGLTAAVATVRSVRVSMMKLIYNVEEQYTEIQFRPDEDASFDVPAEWAGSYFLSFVPEGYSLAVCSEAISAGQEVIFENAEGNLLRFSEMSLRIEANINTEGFRIRPVQINGRAGFLAENVNETIIVWSVTDRCFILSVQGTEALALQLAQSVVRIK